MGRGPPLARSNGLTGPRQGACEVVRSVLLLLGMFRVLGNCYGVQAAHVLHVRSELDREVVAEVVAVVQ